MIATRNDAKVLTPTGRQKLFPGGCGFCGHLADRGIGVRGLTNAMRVGVVLAEEFCARAASDAR